MEVKASPNRPARILVLGVERSGTSVVTGMVHRWGTYAAEPEQLTTTPEVEW
jgi:hypothetical protein